MSEVNQDSDSPPPKKLKMEEPVEADADMSEGNKATSEDMSELNKYDEFVTQEELEKLKEFQVLDEVKSNDEDSHDEESDSSDGKSEELPEEEIEKMLEEDLPDDFKGTPKPKEKSYITRQKIVLEEKGINHFEVLPLDWMMVRHHSGMPVYMHRTTRVCTLSKPYFLGKGNTRRHEIPISAIPCLAYRKALEEEAKQKEIDKKIEEQMKNGTWIKNLKSNAEAATSNSTNSAEVESNNDTGCDKTFQSDVALKCPYSKSVSNNNSEIQGDDGPCVDTNVKEVNSKVVDPAPDDQDINPDENGKDSKGDNDKEAQDGVVCENGNEESKKDEEMEIPLNRQPVVLPGGIVMPPPRVETVNTSWKTQHLTHEQLNDYCKNLFKFKTVQIMHFPRWADRRKYTKARKTLQYPTLPAGTKLITIPVQPAAGTNAENGGKGNMRDWVMHMNGRSYLSVFHEYVHRALQKQPVYKFVQLENACTPYQATVYIGGMQYGVGRGSSKRQAKAAAARASIHILIPEMRDQLDAHADPPHPDPADFTFFDYVGIEDPRITEFCAATCEPSPHAILLTCLLRNFGAGDRHIHTEMKKLEFQKIELTMKVGKHSATVVCKNKKTAKQRASQAILQALHPHVRSWGSLLRLYGSRSVKSSKERKLEEQQITLLQDKARHNEPNHAVLDKLRHEMRSLRARDHAVAPVGQLLLRSLPTHSAAGLGHVQL